MTGGSEASRVYHDAMTAQLGERMTNLGRQQTDLENEMRSGFKQMGAARLLVGQRDPQFHTDHDCAIGRDGRRLGSPSRSAQLSAAWRTGRSSRRQTILKASVLVISEKMVTQKEMEWRIARSAEDRQRTGRCS